MGAAVRAGRCPNLREIPGRVCARPVEPLALFLVPLLLAPLTESRPCDLPGHTSLKRRRVYARHRVSGVEG
jgi:hypothetical protein